MSLPLSKMHAIELAVCDSSCEGMDDIEIQDDEGNQLHCYESDESVSAWCLPCLAWYAVMEWKGINQ